MKHLIYNIIAIIAVLAMFALGSNAQVRRSGGSASESSETTQSSGTVRRSSSSSGGTSTSQVYRRSSGTSTGNRSDSSSVRRSAGSGGKASGTVVRRASGAYGRESGTTVRRSSGTLNGSAVSGNVVRRYDSDNTDKSNSNHRVARTIGSDDVRSIRRGNQDESTTVSRTAATSNGAGQVLRNNNNVTRRGLTSVNESEEQSVSSSYDDIRNFSDASSNQARRMNDRYDDFYIDNHDVMRIHPRERDFIVYDRLGYFYGAEPHYFGYRVTVLPPRYKRARYYGIDYYYYNDVYYRPYGGCYVVCRPPFGVYVNAGIGSLSLSIVNFAFYTNEYRSYSGFDSYSRYIDRQNMIIARNNSIMAARNNYIAMNLSSARNSYSLANSLGLVQSYAYANQEYYYRDGVFYVIDRGQYKVIVPPAGALVEELPDDYDIIILGGVQYYRVDDTVYRVTLINGRPFLEVLGQMCGSLAIRYSNFYN